MQWQAGGKEGKGCWLKSKKKRQIPMGPLRVGAGEGKPDAKGANSKELPRPSESLHARYLAGVLIPALPGALLVPSVK